MHLVGIDERVNNVFVEVERVICRLELRAVLGSFDEVVLMRVMRSVVASLELVLGVNDGSMRLLGAAMLDVARLDAEHERNADHHNEHKRIHQLDLIVVAAFVAKEWGLVRVRRLATAHRHVQHRVDDGGSA